MNKRPNQWVGFLLLGFLLITAACKFIAIRNASDQEDCEAKGGIWKSVIGADGKKIETCEMTVYDPDHACNASELVTYTTKLLKDEVNEFNTRLCTYEVYLDADPGDEGLWMVGLVHKADVYAGTEDYEWQILSKVEKGVPESYLFSGYLNVYNEPDAQGPSLLDLEQVIGIYDTSDCASLRFDEEYLELAAKKIPATCKE